MKIFKLRLSEGKKFIGSVVHGSRFRAETIINEIIRKMNVIRSKNFLCLPASA